jgi:AraC-like DNA-binding protein
MPHPPMMPSERVERTAAIGHDAAPTYHEWPPPPRLAPYVTCLWTRDAGAGSRVTRVVPDGCVDVMWITDGGDGRLVVAGPDTGPHLSSLPPGGRIAGVRFAPGTATEVLGVPLHALRDARPDLAELWGGDAADALVDIVTDAPAGVEPEHVLAHAVARRASAQPDPAMRQVVRVLGAARGPAPVRELASAVGLSERQLHRRCTDAFGYGPKTMQRVLRFQAALTLARGGHDLARVAHECGYADQPHLARDVLDLAGVPITTLLAA